MAACRCCVVDELAPLAKSYVLTVFPLTFWSRSIGGDGENVSEEESVEVDVDSDLDEEDPI